jgi:hypothetical protein
MNLLIVVPRNKVADVAPVIAKILGDPREADGSGFTPGRIGLLPIAHCGLTVADDVADDLKSAVLKACPVARIAVESHGQVIAGTDDIPTGVNGKLMTLLRQKGLSDEA